MSRKGLWLTFALILAVLPVVAGCRGGVGVSDAPKSLKAIIKPFDESEKASLTVMNNYGDEKSFVYNYGPSYLVKYPNFELSFVVPPHTPPPDGQDPWEVRYEFIEEQQPDILVITPSEVERYVKKGLLYDLDPLIKADNFDIENIFPGAVDMIRSSSGNGKLYGLGPTFFSSALFYNKDLFDKYGIPYPNDRMSWYDVFELAKKFPTDASQGERIYGLESPYGDISYFFVRLASDLGLSDFDSQAKKVTVDDEAHRKLLNSVLDMYGSGAMHVRSDKEPQLQLKTNTFSSSADTFVAGQAAMAVESLWTLNILKMLKDSNLKPFDWQLATVPVDPSRPDRSTSVQVGSLFAISAKSPNVRAAWQLVKYWNSEEYAAYYAKKSAGLSTGSNSNLLMRTKYNKEVEGRSLEPFYKLKPAKLDEYRSILQLPQDFQAQYLKIQVDQLKKLLDGKQTVDETLKAIQTRGQEALDLALQRSGGQ